MRVPASRRLLAADQVSCEECHHARDSTRWVRCGCCRQRPAQVSGFGQDPWLEVRCCEPPVCARECGSGRRPAQTV